MLSILAAIAIFLFGFFFILKVCFQVGLGQIAAFPILNKINHRSYQTEFILVILGLSILANL